MSQIAAESLPTWFGRDVCVRAWMVISSILSVFSEFSMQTENHSLAFTHFRKHSSCCCQSTALIARNANKPWHMFLHREENFPSSSSSETIETNNSTQELQEKRLKHRPARHRWLHSPNPGTSFPCRKRSCISQPAAAFLFILFISFHYSLCSLRSRFLSLLPWCIATQSGSVEAVENSSHTTRAVQYKWKAVRSMAHNLDGWCWWWRN